MHAKSIFILLSISITPLFFSCGIITEQECDECVEFARFANACYAYFQEERNIEFECYKGLDLDPDNICTQTKIDAGECQYLGSYFFDEEGYWELEENECNNIFDHYASCKNMKRTKKRAFSFVEQRKYYDGLEDDNGNYCRGWFWDDQDTTRWKLEKAAEKRECEEYFEILQDEW